MDELASSADFVWKWLRSPAIGSWKAALEQPLLHALTATAASVSGDEPVSLDIHPFIEQRCSHR